MLHQVLQALQNRLSAEGDALIAQSLGLSEKPDPKKMGEFFIFLFRVLRQFSSTPEPSAKKQKQDLPQDLPNLVPQLYTHLSRFKQPLKVSDAVSFFKSFDDLLLSENKGFNQIIVDWKTWIEWKNLWGDILIAFCKYAEENLKNKKWLFDLAPQNESLIHLLSGKKNIYAQFDDWRQKTLKQSQANLQYAVLFTDWGPQHEFVLREKKALFYLKVQRGQPFATFRQLMGQILNLYFDLMGHFDQPSETPQIPKISFLDSLAQINLKLEDLIFLMRDCEFQPSFFKCMSYLVAQGIDPYAFDSWRLLSEKSKSHLFRKTLLQVWQSLFDNSFLKKENICIWVEDAQWIDKESFDAIIKFTEQIHELRPCPCSVVFNHRAQEEIVFFIHQVPFQKLNPIPELKTQSLMDEFLGVGTYPQDLVNLVKPIKYREQNIKLSIRWQEEIWDFLVVLVMEEKLKWLENEERWINTELLSMSAFHYLKQTWKNAIIGLFEEDKLIIKKFFLIKDLPIHLLIDLIPLAMLEKFIHAGWIDENLRMSNECIQSALEDIIDLEEQKRLLSELILDIEQRFQSSIQGDQQRPLIYTQDDEDQDLQFQFDLGAVENHIKGIQNYSTDRYFFDILPYYAKWNYQIRRLDKNFIAYCFMIKNAISLGLHSYAKNLWELSQVSIAQMSETELEPYLFIKDAMEQQYLFFQNQTHLLLDQLPGNANAKLEMVQIYLLQAQYDEAKALLLPLIPFKREIKFWGRVRFLLAILLHQTKDYESAGIVLDELLSSPLFDSFSLKSKEILDLFSLSDGTFQKQKQSQIENLTKQVNHLLFTQFDQVNLIDRFNQLSEQLALCFGEEELEEQALSFKLQVLQLLVRNLQQEIKTELQQSQKLNLYRQEKMIDLFLQVIYLQSKYQEYEGLVYSLLSYADLLLLCHQWENSLNLREKSKLLLRNLSPYLNHKNDDVIWEVECGICEILIELGQIDEVKKRLSEFTKDNPLFQVSNTTQAITPQVNALSARIYYLLGICDLYAKDYPQATSYLSQASQIFKQLPIQSHYPKTLVALAHTLIETAMIFKKSNQNHMVEKVKHLLEGAKSYSLIVQKIEKDDLFLLCSAIYLQLKVAFIKNEFAHLEHAILYAKQVKSQLSKLQNGKKPCFHSLLIICLIELEILYQLDQQSQEKISLPYDFEQKGELEKLEKYISEFVQAWQKWKADVYTDSQGLRELKINAWEMGIIRKRLQYLKKEQWIDGVF
jgi:hypothetical protein